MRRRECQQGAGRAAQAQACRRTHVRITCVTPRRAPLACTHSTHGQQQQVSQRRCSCPSLSAHADSPHAPVSCRAQSPATRPGACLAPARSRAQSGETAPRLPRDLPCRCRLRRRAGVRVERLCAASAALLLLLQRWQCVAGRPRLRRRDAAASGAARGLLAPPRAGRRLAAAAALPACCWWTVCVGAMGRWWWRRAGGPVGSRLRVPAARVRMLGAYVGFVQGGQAGVSSAIFRRGGPVEGRGSRRPAASSTRLGAATGRGSTPSSGQTQAV